MKKQLLLITVSAIVLIIISCDYIPSGLPPYDNPNDPHNPDSAYYTGDYPVCPDVQLMDGDIDEDEISGSLEIQIPADESDIEGYRLYWGNSSGIRQSQTPLVEIPKTGSDITYEIPANTAVDTQYLLVFSYSGDYDALDPYIMAVDDLVMTRITDINPNNQNSSPRYLTLFNNRIYFNAFDGTNSNLWEFNPALPIDNDNVNPALRNPKIIDVLPAYDNESPYSLFATADRLYFIASYGALSSERAVYYLSNAGSTDRFFWSMSGLTQLDNLFYWDEGDDLFLSGYDDDPDYGIELYRDNDIWPTYPSLVADLFPGSGGNGSWPRFLTEFNDGTSSRLVFCGENSTSNDQLWVWDDVSLEPVGEINVSGGDSIADPVVYNNELYFRASDGTANHGLELFRWDGTNPPELAADVGRGAPNGSGPGTLTVHNGRLFFQAYNTVTFRTIYEFHNETAVEIAPSVVPSGYGVVDTVGFCSFDGDLYYSANTASEGQELWVYKSNELSCVVDLNPGSAASSPDYLLAYNNRMYMSANDGLWGKELWSMYYK